MAGQREHKLQGDSKLKWRQKHAKPTTEKFFNWVRQCFDAQGFLPSSRFTKALNYIRQRRAWLMVYLDDSDVTIDTTHLERALRVFPMGRKTGYLAEPNWEPNISALSRACSSPVACTTLIYATT